MRKESARPLPRGSEEAVHPVRHGTAIRHTSTWDVALEHARRQAETYARSLPPAEASGGCPPFLIVVDVGATFVRIRPISSTTTPTTALRRSSSSTSRQCPFSCPSRSRRPTT